MKRLHPMLVLVLLMVLGACVCTVSAADSLTVQGTNLAGVGTGGNVNLILNSAINGVSGYNVTFTIDNSTVASITGVNYPLWALPGFYSSSAGPNNVIAKVADVTDGVPIFATNAPLATATVKGVNKGCANVTVTVNRMDDNFGSDMTNTPVSPGYIAVAGSPGSLTVKSSPPMAWIFIDGVDKTVRTNSTVANLDPGVHTVTVKNATYVDQTMQVIVLCGGTVVADFGSLKRPAGGLTVKSIPDLAEIYIDGMDSAHDTGVKTNTVTPFTGLAATQHTVGVKRQGYLDQIASITLTAVPFVQNFVLKSTINDPPYGYIQVDSTPQGASIILDGSTMSLPTPGTVAVDPGTHNVSVYLAGFKIPENQTFTDIQAGQTLSANFALDEVPFIPAKVKIRPNTLNIGHAGKFIAFITLPKDHNAADVVTNSIVCEGQPALRVIKLKPFPHLVIAIFDRSALNVAPGDRVPLHVSGLVNDHGTLVNFRGFDDVRIMNKKDTRHEDTDDLDRMNDDKVFRQFYPGDD